MITTMLDSEYTELHTDVNKKVNSNLSIRPLKVSNAERKILIISNVCVRVSRSYED